jgi:two-component system sensor histidine kinase YesM
MIFVMVAAFMLFVSALGIDRIVRTMLRQFYSILDGIHRVQKGDLNVRVDDHGTDEMGELGTQLNKMLDRIQALMSQVFSGFGFERMTEAEKRLLQ